jgi:hypothetical protein
MNFTDAQIQTLEKELEILKKKKREEDFPVPLRKRIFKGDLYTWVKTPDGPTYVVENKENLEKIELRRLFTKEIALTCTALELLNPKRFRFDGTLK